MERHDYIDKKSLHSSVFSVVFRGYQQPDLFLRKTKKKINHYTNKKREIERFRKKKNKNYYFRLITIIIINYIHALYKKHTC